MNKLFKLITGELLALANREFRTGSFYALKDRILAAHGTLLAGYDAQHVVKKCYKCEEGRISQGEFIVHGQIWRPKGSVCPRCGGSGIFDEFWVALEVYRLGRHEFHKPVYRVHDREGFEAIIREKGITPRIHFEGLIRHEAPRFRLGYEAGWWLVLLFAPKDLRSYWFGMTWIAGAFLPLLLVNNLIFFWNNSIAPHLKAVRRRLCWHEFDTDVWAFTAYDCCKKCGAERWQIDGDDSPYPF